MMTGKLRRYADRRYDIANRLRQAGPDPVSTSAHGFSADIADYVGENLADCQVRVPMRSESAFHDPTRRIAASSSITKMRCGSMAHFQLSFTSSL